MSTQYQAVRRFNNGGDATDGSGGCWVVRNGTDLLCENCTEEEAKYIADVLNAHVDAQADPRHGRCACVWTGNSLKVVCFAHLHAVREFDSSGGR